MIQDVHVEELVNLIRTGKVTAVDVRSPQEYREATIPGSLNIPLFDDEERKEIGILYKQVSIQAAKERGLEIVSRKLPDFIKAFAQISGRKAVFCWRGGMRSKTTATVLSLMGIPAYRLHGGYRAYRKWVVDSLEAYRLKPSVIVINGYTGTGKTKILRILSEKGYPVIDLEGLAQHRGSIFGQIGLEPNNQKTFDALLLERLAEVNDAPYVLIEAESPRVGKVVLPEFLIRAKETGVQLFLEMPVKERVRHILEDYEPIRHHEACLAAFMRIKQRIHTPAAKAIEEDLKNGRYDSAVEALLAYYYDSRYEYAVREYAGERIKLKVNHAEEAVEKIVGFLERGMLAPAGPAATTQ
ncbi:tRNA 2-selenouridine(34) synthase MnmH [Ferviditalea candida]|uniref:tRNA 2-selenouridine(34) synthase MnmH n=1 Tax=Ferviditalea candida TaxID=3108399 RepID=A0ABU5ZCQ8_9BACL|nr:tRNA 2-selenouridine(34) synthase MnmH [Paenibacillaceae bacterium T2]